MQAGRAWFGPQHTHLGSPIEVFMPLLHNGNWHMVKTSLSMHQSINTCMWTLNLPQVQCGTLHCDWACQRWSVVPPKWQHAERPEFALRLLL